MNAPRPFAEYDPEVCLNCDAGLQAGDRFCRDCGQRNRTHARSFVAWIGEGLASLFHVEGKLVNTLRDLPKPGRYAYRYLNGRRERYVHPLRLLLFSSLVSFAALAALGTIDDELDYGGADLEKQYARAGEAVATVPLDSVIDTTFRAPTHPLAARAEAHERAREVRERLNSLVSDRVQLEIDAAKADALGDEARADELETQLDELDEEMEGLENDLGGLVGESAHPAYRRMRQVDQLRADLVAHDRAAALATDLLATGYARELESRRVLDTVLASFPMPRGWGADGELWSDENGPVMLFGDTLSADPRLLATGTPQQIADSARLTNPLSRLLMSKGVAMYHDGVENILAYLLANLTWAVLLFVPLIALGYFLFYWRRMPYYTQNLAYAAILLSVTLLVAALGTGFATLGIGAVSTPVLGLGLYGYMIAGEAYLYEVVWWKAWLKNVAIGFYGIFAFTAAVLLWLLLAVLLA